jgi:hypothetical protein
MTQTATTTVTIKDPKAPATEKQVSFLTSLVKDRECPTVAERLAFAQGAGFLSKGAASKLIDQALKAPKKGATAAAPAPVVAAEAPKPLELTELPAFGYYMITDQYTGTETLYYWDCTGKDGFPTLRKLSIVQAYNYSTGSYAKKGKWTKVYGSYYASPKVEGTWVPYAGKGYNKSSVTKTVTVPKTLAYAVLAGAQPLSETEAGKLGKQFGFCIRCGATLTDPVSVANGLGPVCAKYWM